MIQALKFPEYPNASKYIRIRYLLAKLPDNSPYVKLLLVTNSIQWKPVKKHRKE